jgi:ubiquitin
MSTDITYLPIEHCTACEDCAAPVFTHAQVYTKKDDNALYALCRESGQVVTVKVEAI